jgi:hypothetical protein
VNCLLLLSASAFRSWTWLWILVVWGFWHSQPTFKFARVKRQSSVVAWVDSSDFPQGWLAANGDWRGCSDAGFDELFRLQPRVLAKVLVASPRTDEAVICAGKVGITEDFTKILEGVSS